MSFPLRRVGLSFLCLILATSGAKAAPDKIWTQFSGDKALAHVQRLVDLAGGLAHQARLAEKIELVFVDGEEAFEDFSNPDGIYGSRHFAHELRQDRSAKSFRGGILFDMVGDRSLDITFPSNSPIKITRDIFASADALKLRNYFTYFDQDVTDDHSPLNAFGIPVVDVIDFHYQPWHTAADTMDKISAQSLQVVGSVAAYYLSEFAFK